MKFKEFKHEPVKPDTYEASMARNQLMRIGKHAIKLHNMIDDAAEMESWVAKKIDLAGDYVKKVYNYTEGEKAGLYDDGGMTESREQIGDYAREIKTGRIVRIVDYTDDDEGIYTISYGEGKGETDVTAKSLKFLDQTGRDQEEIGKFDEDVGYPRPLDGEVAVKQFAKNNPDTKFLLVKKSNGKFRVSYSMDITPGGHKGPGEPSSTMSGGTNEFGNANDAIEAGKKNAADSHKERMAQLKEPREEEPIHPLYGDWGTTPEDWSDTHVANNDDIIIAIAKGKIPPKPVTLSGYMDEQNDQWPEGVEGGKYNDDQIVSMIEDTIGYECRGLGYEYFSRITFGEEKGMYKPTPEMIKTAQLIVKDPEFAKARARNRGQAESISEDAGEGQASQKLAQHFQKIANEYKASGDTSDEYEEMQDIADAFRTKGIQAGIDEINSSYFEFSSDPFGRQEQELEPADKDVVDLLKQAGYTYKIVKDPNVSHHTFKRKVVLQKIGKEVSEDAGEDEKIVDMLRNIKQHLDNHPNMSEHPSLVALDQLADDLESGDKPADYESVSEDAGEGHMSKSTLYHTAKYAIALMDMIKPGDDLEGWVQSKLNKAADYLQGVYNYEEYQKLNPYREELNSDILQKHAGIVQKHIDEILAKETKLDDIDTKPGMMRILSKRVNEVEKEIAKEQRKNTDEAHGGQHSTSGRSMTKGEKNKREKIVKGMKKNKAGFKKRYGKDAEAVMYATATKNAMKDDEQYDEGIKDWAKKLAAAGVIVGAVAGMGSINNAIDNSVPAVQALNTAYELAVDQGHTDLANDIKKDLSAVKVRLQSGKDLNFVKDIQNKYSKFVDAGGLPYSIDTEGLAYESKLAVLLNQRLK